MWNIFRSKRKQVDAFMMNPQAAPAELAVAPKAKRIRSTSPHIVRDYEKILREVNRGHNTMGELIKATKIERQVLGRRLNALVERGNLQRLGNTRATHYQLLNNQLSANIATL